MDRTRNAIVRALVVALGLTALTPLAATPASAAATPITVAYRCTIEAFDVSYDAEVEDYLVTLRIPASAAAGSNAVLRWQIDHPTKLPFAVTGVSTQTSAELDVAVNEGTPTTLTAVSDVSDVVDITVGGDVPMGQSMSVLLPITASAGDAITVRPADLIIDFVTADDEGIAGGTQLCTPASPSAEATILVTLPADADPENPCTVISGVCVVPATDGAPFVAGELRQETVSNPGDPIVLGSVTSSTDDDVTLSAPMNGMRVTDLRPDGFGWSLTARLSTPFESPLGSEIAEEHLAIGDIDCDETIGASGSAPSDSGAGGTLDDVVELCSVQPGSTGPNGTGAGQYDVGGTLTLTVPSFTATGAYEAILEIGLS